MSDARRIVLFSPSRHSLYTLAVAHEFKARGVEISGIVIRRLVNLNRFVTEFRRDGARLWTKVWRKLFLGTKAYSPSDEETLPAYLRSKSIAIQPVDLFAKIHGVPTLFCQTLNDAEVLDFLRRTQPTLVVFTGGGIIRKKTLEASGKGIINCHVGILPRFRGMDVVEWAILESRLDEVGITVHFMDSGIDTGPILQTIPVPVRPGETLRKLRNRFEPVMCEAVLNTVCGYLEGEIIPRSQRGDEGCQYFVMHPELRAQVISRLASLS